MSANFVAREVGYQMTERWMQGEFATQAYFKPLETYEERFDALLGEVAGLDFGAIDLWGARLHPDWASPRHIEVANFLLKKHRLEVASLAIPLSGVLSQLPAPTTSPILLISKTV